MATKQKALDKQTDYNIALLKVIASYDEDLKIIAKNEKQLREKRDMLLQQAVDLKITRAGDYELRQMTRVSRKVNMAAIESMLAPEQFKQIAHVTLKDAGQFLTSAQIDKCTSKEITQYWKLLDMRQPASCSKKSVVI